MPNYGNKSQKPAPKPAAGGKAKGGKPPPKGFVPFQKKK
jgi:hypothetical protein